MAIRLPNNFEEQKDLKKINYFFELFPYIIY